MSDAVSNAAPSRSIGEVLALLQSEFPDVTISKIRFLESQGLIDPERTPSGYRRFTDDDVERLRIILHEQRQNHLPLKVIRDRIETTAPLPRPVELVDAMHAERSDTRPADLTDGSFTRDELLGATGAESDLVDQLLSYGLIDGRMVGRERVFDVDDVLVTKLAARLAAHGLEPRHLRSARSSAEREAGLVEQVVAPFV
jgi:DNA-binding transcriptional MerR regulator